jgi:hypothetical protein
VAAASFAIPSIGFSVVGMPANHIPTTAPCEQCHVGTGSSIAATPVGQGARFSGSLMNHAGIGKARKAIIVLQRDWNGRRCRGLLRLELVVSECDGGGADRGGGTDRHPLFLVTVTLEVDSTHGNA